MHVKFVKTAGRAAAAGAAAALGVAFAPAALAVPAAPAVPAPVSVQVPCRAAALAADIAGATSGETLNLRVPCIYVLTEALPDVRTNLTIQGGGFATLQRSFAPGTPDFSILTVDSEVGAHSDLVLNHVNFTNGKAGTQVSPSERGITWSDGGATGDGGAIDNRDGHVTVIGGVFRDNHAGDSGGAVYNGDQFTVTNAAFIGNGAEYGGGIYNDHFATVTGGTFAGNAATVDGGGIYSNYGARVTGATFRQNESEDGGGVFNENGVRLTDDIFLDNHATDDEGGGFYNAFDATVTGGNFTGNTATGFGGGMASEGPATVTGTSFTANSSADGGGLYNEDSLTVTRAIFRHNLAEAGGGAYNDDSLTVRNSNILSNTASHGGGIFNDDETVTLIQTVVAGNKPDNCEPLNLIAGCFN